MGSARVQDRAPQKAVTIQPIALLSMDSTFRRETLLTFGKGGAIILLIFTIRAAASQRFTDLSWVYITGERGL